MDTTPKPMKPFYRFIHRTVRFLFKLFYGHQVIGLENVPRGAAILAPNHTSFLDPPMVGISIDDEIHFLARGSLFAFGPFAWLIHNLNAHPVEPGSKEKGPIELMEQILRSDNKVVIFPEGIRSPDDELGIFRPGAATLALRVDCPIIPIYIHGAFTAWNKNQLLPKPWGKTICIFGKPIWAKPYADLPLQEAKEAILKELKESIIKLREDYLNSLTHCKSKN